MRVALPVVALALLGYGLTIVLGVVAHESRAIGWLSILLGAALLAASLVRTPAPEGTPVKAGAVFRWGVTAVGVVACLGTLAYNLLRGSTLTLAEVALIAYGALLVASLPWLDHPVGRKVTVMTLVAWSFPILLAPLAIYAANGILTSQAGTEAAAASPLVRWLLVAPTAGLLELLGHDVDVRGNSLVLATPRGSLSLSVGLVCAGIYPAILFGGLFALYAWDRKPPWTLALVQGSAGLAALWALNLVRMVILAKVGVAKGTTALQQVHDQIGWLLFAAFSAVYWWLVLRKPHPEGDVAAAPV